MYTYNYRLLDRYNRSVASFAVTNDERAKWQPGKFGYALWGCKISFEFPVVRLMDYKARWAELETNDNPFATVAMAHIKALETQHDAAQRHFWKFYLIRRLYERGYARQSVLNLFHFIDWLLRLPADLEQLFKQQLDQLEAEKHMRYITSVERLARQEGQEEGREEGRQEGRQEIAVRLLLRLLEHRFGDVPHVLQTSLQNLTSEQLEHLMDRALVATTLSDFTTHLPENVQSSTHND